MDILAAYKNLILDKCEICGIRPKEKEKKACRRCIDRWTRKQSMTATKVLVAMADRYMSADLGDFGMEELDGWDFVKGENLFLTGLPGRGKSRAIYALLKNCMIEGCTATRLEFTSLCSRIRATFDDKKAESEDLLVKRFAEYDVLFIDDLGLSNEASDFDYEIFYRITDARLMAMLPTVVASNKDLDAITRMYDERIGSRLRGYFKVIEFTGKDWRTEGK